ncbi:hypothetical protein QQZ08_010125 [Neonectria magnoliae]|uniref:Uncharacterized protein n=1 Tax=Neonectria magnoliae TaxID=2732573 RepID=A0ABR1HJ58_9HYPO
MTLTYYSAKMETHAEFEPEWVWLDDEGTNVYVQRYGPDLTVIFFFGADKHNPPTLLANRVCTKYEGLEIGDPTATFPTAKDLHAAIWDRFVTFGRTASPTLISEPRVDSIDSSVDEVT